MFAVTFEEVLPLTIAAGILLAVIAFPILLSRRRRGHLARLDAERAPGERNQGRSR